MAELEPMEIDRSAAFRDEPFGKNASSRYRYVVPAWTASSIAERSPGPRSESLTRTPMASARPSAAAPVSRITFQPSVPGGAETVHVTTTRGRRDAGSIERLRAGSDPTVGLASKR